MPRRASLAALWLLAAAAAWLALWATGQRPGTFLAEVVRPMAQSPWGPAALLAVYLVRPAVLLPISVLTVFSGFLFGAGWGLPFALVATLASTLLTYLVAARVGTVPSDGGLPGRLRSRTFTTVLIARLAAVPGDLVNASAGAVRAPLGPFLAATALGGLPGLVAGVLAGAALEGPFRADAARLRWDYLLGSTAALLTAVGIAAWLRRRRPRELG